MQPQSHGWEVRFDWILTVFQWTALLLGAFLSTISEGTTAQVALASALAGLYTVVLQVTPRRFRQSGFSGEALALMGVLCSLGAIALTGGINSPYLLFMGGPIFFAGAFLGLRAGAETAVLAIVGVAIVATTLEQDLLSAGLFQASVLYLLIAVAFSQARRILTEERARADELRSASVENIVRVERLIAAHSLLTSLADLADAAELNPVTIGEAALRDLSVAMPFEGGEVSIDGGEGPAVVVARKGAIGQPDEAHRYRIRLGQREVGMISLWAPEPLTEADRAFLAEATRPVALAFDNILLMRGIARRAVREERVRLARDLHDEIGPALASLGLSLDVVIHQYPTTPELARHVENTRQSVTALVDRIRRTVADLREDVQESLVQSAYAIAAAFDEPGRSIRVEIDERRPPRRPIAVEVSAIIAEAVRNAIEHSSCETIRIEGYVDKYEGKLTIADDGKGFDPDDVGAGHFGLIGIRERAARIEADVAIESSPGAGTTVQVQWTDSV